MNTVKIEGMDYSYFGMTDDRRGIITEDRTFWMFPDCHPDGHPVTELPRIGPHEIKAVSFDEPDLTGTYADEAKADYEQYLDYWRKVTPEEHAKQYGLLPGKEQDEEETAYSVRMRQWFDGFLLQFEDGRRRFLAVPFDDYQRDTGKHNAWLRHGTPELVEKYGFRRHMSLYLGMKGQGVNQDEIIPRIFALRYEAHYSDPERTAIYLRALIADRHTPEVLRHFFAYRELSEKAEDPQYPAPVEHAIVQQPHTQSTSAREYEISYDGSIFRIHFHGESFTADDDGGMRFLAYFLLHPRVDRLKARDLYNQIKGLPETALVGEESDEDFIGYGERKIGKSFDQDAHEKNADNAEQDILRLERMTSRTPAEEVELRDLIEYRDKELGKAERGLPDIVDAEMTKRQTIKKAIYRALEKLEKKPFEGRKAQTRDNFVRHVKARLLSNLLTSFSYDPEPDIIWR